MQWEAWSVNCSSLAGYQIEPRSEWIAAFVLLQEFRAIAPAYTALTMLHR